MLTVLTVLTQSGFSGTSRRWRRNNSHGIPFADWGRAAAVARHHSIEVELIEQEMSPRRRHISRGAAEMPIVMDAAAAGRVLARECLEGARTPRTGAQTDVFGTSPAGLICITARRWPLPAQRGATRGKKEAAKR